MRELILSTVAALSLSACATPTRLSTVTAPVADFSDLSCAQLAADIARTQRAYAATRREMMGGDDVASSITDAYQPISLTRSPSAQAPRLAERLSSLQKASRLKRCASVGLRSTTA